MPPASPLSGPRRSKILDLLGLYELLHKKGPTIDIQDAMGNRVLINMADGPEAGARNS
ncbi:hypothetical protein BDV38DRAFT_254504 [Aspergillus pseudotamarii]|uniref:Uncharacterized protein n=1 Tax=Aspergillus pseudotamarii TaxID=132259 RepID=A0A5N6SLP4_ASPPS|nr:uncharacterized protein BDV38DRAFT_254504 [Aspergillus pseudotamarii]KAE8134680.1 hypothetical protein BDV38DRAFT_254504 [Aspergillus pseudotamarii]